LCAPGWPGRECGPGVCWGPFPSREEIHTMPTAHIVTGPAAGAEEATLREYYRLVDADDVHGLLALFADDAVYNRPGYPTMRGRADLTRFYSGERVIARGRHTLDRVVTSNPQVAVTGSFEGVLKDGTRVELRFADFFVFDGGRIARRDTFFFAPMV
jgi:ketosteroid isomerase-like protein